MAMKVFSSSFDQSLVARVVSLSDDNGDNQGDKQQDDTLLLELAVTKNVPELR
jgi:hypothetical protein